MTIRSKAAKVAAVTVVGLAAALTFAAPAQAYGYSNLRMVYGGYPCLRPDSNALGSLVHADNCDSNSDGWYFLYNSTGSAFRLEWLGNGGCLIPNHDALGQPVVVTNGNNGTVCDRPDAWWSYTEDSNGIFLITNASVGLALDYDISGAYRGLQLWNRIYGNTNQEFYFS